jgi:hypothetical protein
VAEVKEYESDKSFKSDSKLEKGIWIINSKPIAIVTTTNIHPDEPDEP